MQSDAETWYKIPGFPKFLVSSKGRAWGPYGERKVRLFLGYPGILCHVGNNKYTTVLLHRALCQIYHGPPPVDKPLALHRNGIKTDLGKDNLYWGDNQDNMDDMKRHGVPYAGENHQDAKLTWDKVRAIRRRSKEGESNVNLAKEYGVSPQSIGYVVRGKTWKE